VRPVSSQEAEEALTSELFESTPLSSKKKKKQVFPREIAADPAAAAVSLITYAGEARRRKKRLLTWRFSKEIYPLY
jgi:hypothetical protein